VQRYCQSKNALPRSLSVDSQFHLSYFTEPVHMDNVCLCQRDNSDSTFSYRSSVEQEIFGVA
jgi:hypothetical protein